jgi:hypothetical protein
MSVKAAGRANRPRADDPDRLTNRAAPRKPSLSGPGEPPLVGAHMSIAGGLHNAILDAARYRCRALQIFSKSSNQWAARKLTEEDVALWRDTLAAHPMQVVVHDSYLINLASPDPALLARSREAFLEEVLRCDRLGIRHLIFHPGAHMQSGEDVGLQGSRRVSIVTARAETRAATPSWKRQRARERRSGTDSNTRAHHRADAILTASGRLHRHLATSSRRDTTCDRRGVRTRSPSSIG